MNRNETSPPRALEGARRLPAPGRTLLAVGLAAVAAGCTIQTEPPEFATEPAARLEIEGYAVVPAPSAPPRPEQHLRVPYRGSDAYLVDGQWFYRSPERGWVIFREEPRELSRYRVDAARPGAPVRVEGHRADRIRRPPAGVDRAPRVEWRGRAAYLIDGEWYTYSPGEGWFILREEPRELGRRRYELRGRGELGYPEVPEGR